ncbi:hypothetical protein [Selenomonas sp. oral taxon 137]|nr:hypothetical protein [Selenomonas sp. oral taxon 137]
MRGRRSSRIILFVAASAPLPAVPPAHCSIADTVCDIGISRIPMVVNA